jgi:hypothetical protein
MILLAAASSGREANGQWSSYDATKIVEITAALEEVMWDQTKVCVTYDGARKEILLAPIARMTARGLGQDALGIGKTVTIEAYPSTQNANELRAERIAVDGRVVALR